MTLLINKDLYNDELINYLFSNNILNNLNFAKFSDSVGVSYINETDRFCSYMTNEKGIVEYIKEYNTFEEALYNARKVYGDLSFTLNEIKQKKYR